jgi:hypothetical protein
VMVWRARLGVATKNSGKNYGTFFTSLLRVPAGFASKQRSLVDAISHTREVRNILLKHGIKWSRQPKITLGYGLDPECHLNKRELKN